MTFREFIKSRRKKAVLFFWAGFFFGAILYYLCQEPAADVLEAMEEKMMMWAEEKQDFLGAFLFVLWERGKVFSVLWLAGYTKVYKAYICAFIAYVGIQSGFLLTFFVMLKGTRGILCWLLSGFPHLFILVPVYLFSFYRIMERRREKVASILVLTAICLVVSCVLEARVNVPVMQWIYS